MSLGPTSLYNALIRRSIDLRRLYQHVARRVAEPGLRSVLQENAAALELLKPDAILLNTARGALIDEDSLVAKLRTSRLYAVLDVTDPEPPAPDHPFRTLPNCVLTGHVAGAVNNGLHRLGRHAAAEIESYVDGRPLAGEVYESQLPTLA